MLAAFIVILVDILGFTILVPIFAFYPQSLGASPFLITVIMSIYPLAMFVTAPYLGRASDMYGRRPVLMFSMVGACLGFIILANATSIWMIVLARLLSGAMSGNVAAAQAYMTDISSEADRSKAMGLIGAAFGLGFLIGPIIGAYLAGDNFETANLALPAYVAAAMSATAFLMVLFLLPESLTKEQQHELRQQPKTSRLKEILEIMSRPLASKIIYMTILLNVAAGLFENLFPLWAKDGVQIIDGPDDMIPYLAASGITLAVVQAALVGPLSKRFGEHLMIKGAAVLYGTGIVALTVSGGANNTLLSVIFMCVVAGSSAVITTATTSLMSMRASETERGMVMGVFAAMGTLGRSIGTMLGGLAFQSLAFNAPYYIAAIVMVMLFGLGVVVRKLWAQETAEAAANPEPLNS